MNNTTHGHKPIKNEQTGVVSTHIHRRFNITNVDDHCVTGCKAYTGGEIKHHKDCPFYDGSISQLIDRILTAAKCQTVEEVVNKLESKQVDKVL